MEYVSLGLDRTLAPWGVGECSEDIRGWPETQRPWHQLEFSDWKSMDELACRETEARLVSNQTYQGVYETNVPVD